MTPRAPRRRPAPRTVPRTVRAALAAALALGLAGCGVQGPAPNAGSPASGPTTAPASSGSPASGISSVTGSAPASGTPTAAPSSTQSPGPASSGAATRDPAAGSGDAAALAELFGLPDLTPLLDPVPDPEVLGPALDEALVVSTGTMSAAVVDALTGEVLYDRAAGEPSVPASAVKILTALAALEVLGPGHRYATAAVALPGSRDGVPVTHVVLDAGGDVLMGAGDNTEGADGHAGLGSLARLAAKELAEQDATGTVAVELDDTGYAGPAVSPAWSEGILTSGNASVVQPIATHGGRPAAGADTNRLHDPALYAAEVFRSALAEHAADAGVELEVADAVGRLPLNGRGTELASIQSATVQEQAVHMLTSSDNQVAEATGRNVALAAGQDGSFDGAVTAIVDALDAVGVDTEGLTLVDASGLSGANRVSALQLTDALQAAAGEPELAAAATGLPVAGQEGTLEHRMVGTPAEGAVRAKTGTLSSVASLTGSVETADGRWLLFSFIANDQPGVLTDARFSVDRAAAVLAGCGCRAEE